MIAIIDYDAGNVGSVEKALKFLGQDVTITRDAEKILAAEAGGNWLQRSWRPLVMLVFAAVVLVGAFVPLPMLEDNSRFWDLLEIGLGGYILGRGMETLPKLLRRKKI